MRKAKILSLLILCVATSAFAQHTPEPDVVPTEKEIKSFEAAKVSLAEAINIAAKRHKDAKVVDVSFDSQAGQLAYKVKTYQDNNVWEGAVDAWTGQIIGEGTTTPVKSHRLRPRRDKRPGRLRSHHCKERRDDQVCCRSQERPNQIGPTHSAGN